MGGFLKDPSLSNFVQFVQKYSDSLIKNKIRLVGQSQFLIQLKYSSTCKKVFVFDVYIAFFVIEIEIYNNFDQNFDQMIEKKGLQLGKGSQGQIFKVPFIQGVMKRVSIISSKSLSSSLVSYSLFQYAINKLVSALKIGPKVLKPFMFDLICTRNYIYFFIQKCQKLQNRHKFQTDIQQKITYEKLEKQLKISLCLLHKVQIVHYDIKPQNIMYSPSYDKFVFIDFGLAQSKVFAQGWKEIESFKGTYFYSCDEMKDILIKGRGFVDAYYNDCFCLNKAMGLIKNYQFSHFKGSEEQYHFFQSTQKNHQVKNSMIQSFEYRPKKSTFKRGEKQKEIQINWQLDQKNKNNDLHLKFLNNHKIIYFSHLIYHSFEDQLDNLFNKKSSLVSYHNLQEFMGIFFEFGNFIYNGKIFQLFIQKFILNNDHLSETHSQINFSFDQYNQDQIKSKIQNLKNSKKLTQVFESILIKFPFLLKLIQKYFETNSNFEEELQTMFCFKQIPQKTMKMQFLTQSYNELSKFYYFGLKNTYSTVQYEKFAHCFILADYIAYLYNMLVEFSQDLKDQYRFNHLFANVKIFFEVLGKNYIFFKENIKNMSEQQNYQLKLNIIRQSLGQFPKAINQSLQKGNQFKIQIIDKSLCLQISKFGMVCLKLQRMDLVEGIRNIQLQLCQKLFFYYYSGIIKYLNNILDFEDISQINKTLINSAELMIRNSFQKLLYTIQKKCVKLIEVYYQQNQNQMIEIKQNNKLFLQKYLQCQKMLQKTVLQIKSKLNMIKLDDFSVIKLLVYESLRKIYKNQQLIDTILFFKKFQSFISLKFSQISSVQIPCYQLHKQKIGQKLILSFLIYDDMIIGQILFQQTYKSLIQNGYLFKAIKMLEQQIKEKKEKHRNNIQTYWQILVNYYYDLFAICDILGYEQKMLTISKIVRKLKHKQFNLVSFPRLKNKQTLNLIQQDKKCFQEMKRLRSKPFVGFIKFRHIHQRPQDIEKIITYIKTCEIGQEQYQQVEKKIIKWRENNILLQKILIQQEGIIIGLKLLNFYINSSDIIKLLDFLQLILNQLLAYSYQNSHLIKTFQKVYLQIILNLFIHQSQLYYSKQITYSDSKQRTNSNKQTIENNIQNKYNPILQLLKIIYQRLKSSIRQKNNLEQKISQNKIPQMLLSWLITHFIIRKLQNNKNIIVLQNQNSQFLIQKKIIKFSYKCFKNVILYFYKNQDSQEQKVNQEQCIHQDESQQYSSCTICVNNYIETVKNDEFFLIQSQLKDNKLWKMFIKVTEPNYYSNLQFMYQKIYNYRLFQNGFNKDRLVNNSFDHNQKISQYQNNQLLLNYNKTTTGCSCKKCIVENNILLQQEQNRSQQEMKRKYCRKMRWINIIKMRSINNIKYTQYDRVILKRYPQFVKRILKDLQDNLQNTFKYNVPTKSIIMRTLRDKIDSIVLHNRFHQ